MLESKSMARKVALFAENENAIRLFAMACCQHYVWDLVTRFNFFFLEFWYLSLCPVTTSSMVHKAIGILFSFSRNVCVLNVINRYMYIDLVSECWETWCLENLLSFSSSELERKKQHSLWKMFHKMVECNLLQCLLVQKVIAFRTSKVLATLCSLAISVLIFSISCYQMVSSRAGGFYPWTKCNSLSSTSLVCLSVWLWYPLFKEWRC